MWKGSNSNADDDDDDDDKWSSTESRGEGGHNNRQFRLPSPWSCSLLIAFTTVLAVVFLLSIVYSFAARSAGSNGCGVPMMNPTFIRMVGFDTEHTRFASKYNLFLYREEGVDQYNQENIGVCLIYTHLAVYLLLLTLPF